MKVVEFGTYWAGPLLGKFLAQQGHAVTSVGRPDDARGAAEEQESVRHAAEDLHRGKERVVLRLPAQRTAALALVREADVVIENFGEGVASRLGIAYDDCKRVNAHVVYVRLPAFASDDALRRATPGWESVIMGLAGVFCDMGLNRTLRGIRASYSLLPLASVYGALFGFLATQCALYGDRSRASYVEVPLASALIEALVHNMSVFPMETCYMNARQRRLASGHYPIGDETLRTLFDPFFCKYACSDARHIYLVCPGHRRHQTAALAALGLGHIVDSLVPTAEFASSARGIGAGHLSDAQSRSLRPLMAHAFLAHPSDYWEGVLGLARVPAMKIRTTAEWTAESHCVASGLYRDGCVGDVVWSDEEVALPDEATAPTPSRDRGCLHGIRVLDLTNVIAGPTAGHMLARFGADVVKIDATTPSYSAEIAVFYGTVANIGKRSALLDAARPRGRAALLRLAKDADVVLVNCTDEALVRLGLTRARLREVNPRLILARFDAWGGPRGPGAFDAFVGYDDNVQAATGIMARFGGGGVEDAEEHAHVGTIDVIAGVAMAASVVAALLRRRDHGRVGVARTSLAAVGMYVQYPYLFREETNLRHGRHPLHWMYPTMDERWIMLVEHESKIAWQRVLRACNIPSDARSRASDVRRAIARRDSTQLVRAFRDEGVTAVVLRDITTVRNAPDRTFQFVTHLDHPIGTLTMPAPCAVRGLTLTRLQHAPKYGAHTRDVLREVHKEHLVCTGDAACAWSATYVPFRSKCDRCRQPSQLTVLACAHKICSFCAFGTTCPCCGAPHLLDVPTLRTRTRAHVRAYAAWRRGASKGADDPRRIVAPGRDVARRIRSA